MVLLPARCTHCGHEWQPTHGIEVSNSRGITFTGSTIPCPECGKRADFVAGKIDVRDDGIRFRSGPQWSQDLIQKFGLELVELVEDPPEDLTQAIAALNKDFGDQFAASTKGMTREKQLKLLGYLAQPFYTLAAVALGPKVIDAMLYVLQYVERHGFPPPMPPW